MARTPEHEQSPVGEAYRAFRAEVSRILFDADPIGINHETNTDEYDPEARMVVPRLGECSGPDDVTRIVHEEFVQWFSNSVAGPREKYGELGKQIWQLWDERGSPDWLSSSPETDSWAPDLVVDLHFRGPARGGRKGPLPAEWFGCPFEFQGEFFDCRIDVRKYDTVSPGDIVRQVPLKFLSPHLIVHRLDPGLRFTLWETGTIADGAIVRVTGRPGTGGEESA